MCSLSLTQNVLTLRDEIKGMMNWSQLQLRGAMFICTFLGGVLHNRLSTSGAWGAITTVNGSSTRSGFRDKSGFSHQLYSPFRHLCPVGFYQKPSEPERNVSCTKTERGGGGADADSYTVIFERFLHYTSQIWQANPGCKSFQCEIFSLHQSVPIITEA